MKNRIIVIMLAAAVAMAATSCDEMDFVPQRTEIDLYCGEATNITTTTVKIEYGSSGTWEGGYFSNFGIEIGLDNSFREYIQIGADDNTFNNGRWTMSVKGLEPSTKYYYRTYASDVYGNNIYSTIRSFTTLAPVKGVGTLDDYLGTYSGTCKYFSDDGRTYSWTGTTFSLNSQNYIFIEGFFDGKSFFCAWGTWDSKQNLIKINSGFYNTTKTYYFDSNSSVYYYATVYTMYDPNNYIDTPEYAEGLLVRSSDGKITYVGGEANYGGNIANCFQICNIKVSDKSESLYGTYKDLVFTPTN